MKRTYLVFVLLLIAFLAQGQTVLLTENFNYTAGDSLKANGWTGHSGGTTNSMRVTSPGLSWTTTPYRANNIGNAAGVNNTGSDENRNFSSYPTTGDVFISFMVKVNAPTTNLFFLHTGQYANTATPVFSAINSGFRGRVFAVPGSTADKFRFGLTFNAATVTNTVGTDVTQDLDTSKTYLVVLKYRFVSGTLNDQVSLFVFEDGANIATEPATPTLGPLTGTAADADVLQHVTLRQDNASQRITVDGIVAQTSWDMLATNTWNGTSWSAGQAPSRENAVIDGNLTLSSSITAGNVTINTGFNVTLGSGNDLVVQGNLINNGQVQMGSDSLTLIGAYSGTGTIRSNGGSLIIQGTGALGTLNFDQTTDGSTNVLANLNLNRSSSGTATLGNKLNLTGTLTFTNGTLNTGGNLHLKSSSASATAQVIGGTNSSISGNVTVERFLPWQSANNNGFRFTSHSLQAAPALNTVTGLPNGSNTVIGYDEDLSTTNGGYIAINDRNTTWGLGKSVGIWTNAVNTISYTGALQLSDLNNVSVDFAGTSTGWNFMGNPFPSVLDFDALTRTNVNNASYVWIKDNTGLGSGQWGTYINGTTANGGNRYLAPGQGFFVQANASSASISFPVAARVSGQTPAYNLLNPNEIKIKVLKISNETSFETVIKFEAGATISFDASHDAKLLIDESQLTPDLYTVDLNGVKYTVNSLPIPATNEAVVHDLWLETFGGGSYRWSFDLSNLQHISNVQLMDTKLGLVTPISHGQEITFEAGVNDLKNRFRIGFNSQERANGSVSTNDPLLSNVFIYGSEKELFVRGLDTADEVRITDLSGRIVHQVKDVDLSDGRISHYLSPGTYFVQIVHQGAQKTAKIVLL